MLDIGATLLIIAALLVVVSLIQPLSVRLRLPHTVLLAVVGVAIGAAAVLILDAPASETLGEVAGSIVNLPFRSETFLYVFLPVLLFQAALTIEVRRVLDDAAPILLLAVGAVLVSTAAIGFALAPLTPVPLLACLLLGAIVATTDPSAVVAVFRDIGAPARLTRLVEGESLLNDATAIALFSVLLGVAGAGTLDRSVAGGAVVQFLGASVGGVALGFMGGRLFVAILPALGDLRSAEVTLTLALPYLVYIVGEGLLHVSGVVAVATAGLTLSALGRARVAPDNWAHLESVWEQIAFWAGSLIFVLASILAPRLLATVRLADILLLAVLVAAALLARAAVLFLLLPVLSALRLSERVEHAHKAVILWGGLRGAITLVLALAVTEDPFLEPPVARFVTVLATGFVLVTLLVNGTTLRALIRFLGLDRLSPLNRALRDQVFALSLANVRDGIQETARAYEIPPTVARSVAGPYEARIVEAAGGAEGVGSISDRDRFTIGLIALANHERERVLAHHGQRTVSLPIVEALLRNIGRIVDEARANGRLGYNRAAERALRYRRPFRVALALQRRLGVTRPLARQLADRFELLLVSRLVIQELKGFNRRRLKPLLGGRVAELLDEVLEGRYRKISTALDALRLQYPEYAEALERRFLRQSALRHEQTEYQTLFREGLINQELHDSLRRDIQAAVRDAERRPPLDLSLETRDLIRHVDLFRALGDRQTERIGRLLKSRFVVPGEKIVRAGERGRTAYFIASGAVEVVRGDHRVRLGRGDFFGEMALFTGAPRSADVVALTYGHLLVLHSADLERFLKADPTLQTRIDGVLADRLRVNAQGAKALS